MFRRRILWIVLLIVLALAGGGYGYYRYYYVPGQEPEVTLMTAEVAQGDLIISVSGSGVLAPAEERELGFETESGDEVVGFIDEVLVEVGDQVEAGDVLARLETYDLELAVARAEISLRQAALDLAERTEEATEAELADARAALESAELTLSVAQYSYQNATMSEHDAAAQGYQIDVVYHTQQIQELEASGTDEETLETAWDALGEAEAALDEALQEGRTEDLQAWNEVDQAQNRVVQAEDALASLETGPDEGTVLQAELKVDRAELALEEALDDLAAAELVAPFDGVVVDVEAIPGQRVGNAPVITLADMANPLVQFWVEESDLSQVAVGNRVEIEFEGLPDELFDGEVVRIDPALVTVDNSLAVQAYAALGPSTEGLDLLGDMNVDIEVISVEARDVVLAPVQALREIAEGVYAVFVVQPDGELAMRPVELGLQDVVNAEITSGLEAGEVISLGQTTSGTGGVAEGEEEMPAPGMMMPGAGMLGGGGRP
ncbi:MAG: efflux RND transporter periplasmic adaptor subunit [Anaerolineae bacterium]|jgi:HlyD family secretion protein